MYFNKKTSGQLTLVAQLKAQSGKEQQLCNALMALMEPTRIEEGCVSYHLYRNIEDPATFIFHETWASEAIWQKHMQAEHIKSFFETADDMLDCEPILNKLERSDAEGPISEKGMLVLFAFNYAKEGVEKEWRKILEDLIEPTLAEKGAMHYELHLNREDSRSFMFHETWATVEDWNNHMETPHLKNLLDIIDNYTMGGISVIKAEIIS